MSPIIIIAIVVLVVLAGVGLIAAGTRRDSGMATGELSSTTRKRDKQGSRRTAKDEEILGGRKYERAAIATSTEVEVAEPATPTPWVAPEVEQVGVSRRQFLNRSIVGFMALGLGGFGTAVVAFLWPSGTGGFGSAINLGPIDEVKQAVVSNSGFFYVPEGRMWVTAYPEAALEKARSAYSGPELAGMEAGLLALWQTCPHLGCMVPECVTSQWFECPCHGSTYNRVGEKKGGPAPRGMDRFAMSVDSGNFVVDTGTIIAGPPVGTNTTGQEAEGPHCI